MTKLKELEERLRDEPDNLGLRVMVAGALHEAGRRDDAIELYRSVALAYRDQGRPQQAITVCRGILELAPDNAPSQELLASLLSLQQTPRGSPPPAPREPSPLPVRPSPTRELSPLPQRPSPAPSRPSPSWLPRPPTPPPEVAEAEPVRRSRGDTTPLPSLQRLPRSELPPSLQEELASYPEIAGIAAAARQISASLIAAARREGDTEELDEGDLIAEADTGRRSRASRATPSASVPPPLPRPPTPPEPATATGDEEEPTLPPPPGRAAPRPAALDDEPTLLPSTRAVAAPATVEDEKTQPRDISNRARPPALPREVPPPPATGPLTGAFFAPLPPRNRGAVLQRFRRRIAPAGAIVIRRGETGHGLIVAVRGRLELHAERAGGVRVALGAIAAGEFIGEASLLARTPAAAQVVAGTDAELLVLAADDFYDVASAFPALRSELERVAALRAEDHARQLG